ncbi:hypothetical protein PHYPSEUDO_007295 [Phytophthora pseudosyringae]|uniref:Uncharacterized protein n=1 Tax=Phytophthora pseudosyringae TaxID=221518 RepID=A0A8T1VJM5_9STRA|nr:hypothetical protein PHYPSEUDO_007295 [Phytophthora pseudosyringae]
MRATVRVESLGLGNELTFENDAQRPRFSAMQASRPSTPTKMPSPKSATAVWTARLVATLWKLAVKRARKLRRQAQGAASHSDIMFGSEIDAASPTSGGAALDLHEASIMHAAALSVVASGVVSLADLEAVTGYRLPKTHGGDSKDDDDNSDAATDTSDSCSVAGSDLSESTLDEEVTASRSREPLSRRASSSSSTPAKWVCVGYGRYVKAQE